MLPVISDPESLTPMSSRTQTDTKGAADETGRTDDLLADRRRRSVLEYLDEREDESPVSLSDLADHVTLEEEGKPRGALAGCGDALFGTRRRVRISLRHHHLPKLAEADAVAFDLEANTVALRERGTELLARGGAINDEAGNCRRQFQ